MSEGKVQDERGVSETAQEWVIEPRRGVRLLDWKELRNYRDLLFYLVLRDIQILYKQTVLGVGWAVVQPVTSMVVFSVVFGGLARVPSDGVPYPIFTFSALVPWLYFSGTVSKATGSLISNANMLTKIYFPRIFIPLVPVLSGLLNFGISLAILLLMMLFYGVTPTVNVIFLPVLILILMVFSAGMAMWMSAFAIQYRDLRNASRFVTQLLMYLSPVVWPVSLLLTRAGDWAGTVKVVYGLYPMAGVIEGFRAALLGTRPMPWDMIGVGAVGAFAIWALALLYFRSRERVFADVV